MKKILIRSISGIVYIALVVASVLAGGWWLYAFFALLAAIGMLEYHNLTAHRTGAECPAPLRAIDMSAVLALTLAPMLQLYDPAFPVQISIPVVCVMYLMIRLTASLMQKHGDAFGDAATGVLGFLYIGLPITALIGFRVLLNNPMVPTAILLMFVLIWLNDTGAFCAGSLLGRHRLCERLSPKKSWEGFWGGMILCMGAAAGFAAYSGGAILQSMGFAVVVSLFSTWGDLFESMLKRSAGLKDSGHIMPGHGGILDRIDSLLFVVPASLIYLIMIAL